jgi:4-amino-4-deoxy-L-arabinose transferase-like glycosyltransferase
MSARGRWIRLALCALAAAVVYLPALGAPALWEPDEGRYAEIAREMLLSADYVTPRDDFVRYFEKPPLMYWATAASIHILGENEFAVRLPAALFSIGEVIVTCALAETMFGASVGLLAALALALSPLVWGFARFITLDPALAFFVTAALAAFYTAATVPRFLSRAARRWLIVSAVMVAMGTLTKGPVALIICGGVALIYLAMEQRLRELAAIPWLECSLIFAAIVLPWFAAVAVLNPEFLSYFFIHEHLHRYLANTEHGWGPWFLIVVAAAGAWPWLWFVPLGITNLRRDSGREPRIASALRFLMIWFLFVLVFFSIPRSKLGSYILPAMPALAIVAGYGLKSLSELDRERLGPMLRWFAIVNGTLAGAGVVMLVFAAASVGRWVVVDGIFAAVGLALGGAAAYRIATRSGNVSGAIVALAIAVVAAGAAALRAPGDAAASVSARRLALAIRPALSPGCVLASYGHQVQSLPFYTRTREVMVNYLGELGNEQSSPDGAKSFMTKDALAALWGSAACVVMIANSRDYDELAVSLKPEPSVIACEGKKVALSNQPGRGTTPAFDCVPEAARYPK